MKVEEELKKQISKEFSSRVITLLFYGSRAFSLNTHQTSDYDFILVIDRYQSTDTSRLNYILNSDFFKNLPIEINLVYKEDMDIRGKENFQMRTSLATYYQYLETITPILGDNIFARNHLKLTLKERKKMHYFKIQEYYGRIDKILIENELTKQSMELAAKYCKDMARYFVLSQGYLNEPDIQHLTFAEIIKLAITKHLLPSSIFLFFQNILNEEYNYYDIESARRIIYDSYLKLFEIYKHE